MTRAAGPDSADTATLAFAATDVVSGVARTLYRVDGGAWTAASGPVGVSGYGDHVVDFASTDKAGNAEVMRHATVSLTDVETISTILVPQVSGTPRIGSTLSGTDGIWNTQGLSFTRQWLRDGVAVPGATGSSYAVGVADVGGTLSLRVTATKAGRTGVSTSSATAPVARAASSVAVSVNKKKVKAGKKVVVTAVVPGASGPVQFVVDGEVRTTVALVNGAARAQVRVTAGEHLVQARYLGSATSAPADSATVTVRGTRKK